MATKKSSFNKLPARAKRAAFAAMAAKGNPKKVRGKAAPKRKGESFLIGDPGKAKRTGFNTIMKVGKKGVSFTQEGYFTDAPEKAKVSKTGIRRLRDSMKRNNRREFTTGKNTKSRLYNWADSNSKMKPIDSVTFINSKPKNKGKRFDRVTLRDTEFETALDILGRKRRPRKLR